MPFCLVLSYINKDNKPCKMKIDPNQHEFAICCTAGWEPLFGKQFHDDYGCDIDMGLRPNKIASSSSYLDSS